MTLFFVALCSKPVLIPPIRTNPDKTPPSPQICPLMINDFHCKPGHRRPVLTNENRGPYPCLLLCICGSKLSGGALPIRDGRLRNATHSRNLQGACVVGH